MTQYVYGKNVVKQLLQDGKPIHEVLIQEGIRDTALEGEIKKDVYKRQDTFNRCPAFFDQCIDTKRNQ